MNYFYPMNYYVSLEVKKCLMMISKNKVIFFIVFKYPFGLYLFLIYSF